jgi:hypothetical protein
MAIDKTMKLNEYRTHLEERIAIYEALMKSSRDKLLEAKALEDDVMITQAHDNVEYAETIHYSHVKALSLIERGIENDGEQTIENFRTTLRDAGQGNEADFLTSTADAHGRRDYNISQLYLEGRVESFYALMGASAKLERGKYNEQANYASRIVEAEGTSETQEMADMKAVKPLFDKENFAKTRENKTWTGAKEAMFGDMDKRLADKEFVHERHDDKGKKIDSPDDEINSGLKAYTKLFEGMVGEKNKKIDDGDIDKFKELIARIGKAHTIDRLGEKCTAGRHIQDENGNLIKFDSGLNITDKNLGLGEVHGNIAFQEMFNTGVTTQGVTARTDLEALCAKYGIKAEALGINRENVEMDKMSKAYARGYCNANPGLRRFFVSVEVFKEFGFSPETWNEKAEEKDFSINLDPKERERIEKEHQLKKPPVYASWRGGMIKLYERLKRMAQQMVVFQNSPYADRIIKTWQLRAGFVDTLEMDDETKKDTSMAQAMSELGVAYEYAKHMEGQIKTLNKTTSKLDASKQVQVSELIAQYMENIGKSETAVSVEEVRKYIERVFKEACTDENGKAIEGAGGMLLKGEDDGNNQWLEKLLDDVYLVSLDKDRAAFKAELQKDYENIYLLNNSRKVKNEDGQEAVIEGDLHLASEYAEKAAEAMIEALEQFREDKADLNYKGDWHFREQALDTMRWVLAPYQEGKAQLRGQNIEQATIKEDDEEKKKNGDGATIDDDKPPVPEEEIEATIDDGEFKKEEKKDEKKEPEKMSTSSDPKGSWSKPRRDIWDRCRAILLNDKLNVLRMAQRGEWEQDKEEKAAFGNNAHILYQRRGNVKEFMEMKLLNDDWYDRKIRNDDQEIEEHNFARELSAELSLDAEMWGADVDISDGANPSLKQTTFDECMQNIIDRFSENGGIRKNPRLLADFLGDPRLHEGVGKNTQFENLKNELNAFNAGQIDEVGKRRVMELVIKAMEEGKKSMTKPPLTEDKHP